MFISKFNESYIKIQALVEPNMFVIFAIPRKHRTRQMKMRKEATLAGKNPNSGQTHRNLTELREKFNPLIMGFIYMLMLQGDSVKLRLWL